ncbi:MULTISPECIES: DUF2062 domain-containing protein [unclassified Haematobacter]|uniref:DUF2062 domain-containing protein n=1 Tax=unclassified Haematobacter TaxID=2640585 RepID=UPI0025B95969|nr:MULTISPECIES: DUF2062 domain-containing protein [unclassified Haematobacter]
MFRRRTPRSRWRSVREFLYPSGGWLRASSYVWHRLRRLPDDPGRVARGIAAGVFISFTPFFGLHFLGAALIAWAIRGNIPAALIATFLGNPLTFPLIATASLEVGYLFTPHDAHVPIYRLPVEFSQASGELWRNIRALFGQGEMHWGFLSRFWQDIFLPYLVGGMLTGIAAGVAAYVLLLPLLRTYHRARLRRIEERLQRARAKYSETADEDASNR